MGREIRRVPENWEHPKRKNGSYHPMFEQDFKENKKEYLEELEKWYKDYFDAENGKVFESFYDKKKYSKELGNIEQWIGPEPPSPPDPKYYMPSGSWYQLFENVSEGTPLSPPFKTKEGLTDWLSNNVDFGGYF